MLLAANTRFAACAIKQTRQPTEEIECKYFQKSIRALKMINGLRGSIHTLSE
jgi:hypothetical protein